MASRVTIQEFEIVLTLGLVLTFAQGEPTKSFPSMSNISMLRWKTSAIVTGLASLLNTDMPEVDA
jgi:hypothetical protein